MLLKTKQRKKERKKSLDYNTPSPYRGGVIISLSYNELLRIVQVEREVQDVLHLKTIRYSDVCTNYSSCVCNVLYVKIHQLVC